VSSPAQRHARGADPPCLPRAPLQRLCQGPPPRGWVWEAGDGCVGVGEAGGLVFQICGISTCATQQTSGPQALDRGILTVKSVSEREDIHVASQIQFYRYILRQIQIAVLLEHT